MADPTLEFPYFTKCIHLEEETGAFIFYSSTFDYIMLDYPTILFKTFDGGYSLNNFFPYFPIIELTRKTLNIGTILNDIIKITNKKLCFSSTSTSKDELYIVLLNIINMDNVVIRYYTIDTYNKYSFVFMADMRLHLYNNYISFGFSFCRQSNCENSNDPHYSGFMIFSYPNGTDYYLNLTEYLFNNDDIKKNNLYIDLKNNVRIENNIFGLVYSNIKITQIINCDNINLLSSLDENNFLTANSDLKENEKIKIIFNSYNVMSCQIKYIYIITEQDFEQYNNYCERDILYGEDTADIFNSDKSTYESKVLNYYIILDEKLETQCTELNCDLCFETKKDYCITCKNNSIYYNKDNIIYKKCDNSTNSFESNLIEINTTQTIVSTQIKIDTTQIIESTKIYLDTTQIIESTQMNIDKTQIIQSTQIKIHTTHIIETTLIDSTQIKIDSIESSQIYIDTTQIIESTQINIDTTLIIETTQIPIKIESTQINIETTKIIESNQIDIDITQIIKTTEIYNIETELGEKTEIKNDDNDSKCTKNEILNNECQNRKMTDEQLGEVYTTIKENILTEDYNRENTIIQTQNVIFQISKLEEQKNNINPNISSIDLGECENLLKIHYNISNEEPLIIVKTDIKNSDLSSTYVQYEIFDPYTLDKLDLKYCNEVKIVINVPINLKKDTISLYESLNKSGYNLFDSGDDFYIDICTTYTSENGTDLTLSDRNNEVFNEVENVSLCQTGCKFESYNITTGKTKCNCDVQTNIQNNIKKINFSSTNLVKNLLITLKNSHFLVLKCYKLAFSFNNIWKNLGRIIMTLIYCFFIIAFLFYIIKDNKKINIFINDIIKNKDNYIKYQKNKIKNKTTRNVNCNIKEKKIKVIEKNIYNKKNEKIINIKKNKVNKDTKIFKNKVKNKDKLNISQKNKKQKNEPPKKKKLNKKRMNIDDINSLNKINNNENSKMKFIKKQNKININIIQNINYENSNKKKDKLDKKLTIYKPKQKTVNAKENNLIFDNKYINYKNLNDHELNTLKYNLAIIVDKRTYSQYYLSLLKKKHLILFTFLPSNDYNLFSLKISLFLLSFSLYFTINGLFFNDATIHKINEDKGNFIIQIPHILYSSVIPLIINLLLRILSLSENSILSIKKEISIKSTIKKAKTIENNITIKFVIFFIISNILLLFFWYFISCFCAVYINTQIILIEDTLASFAFSMVYPFGLYLLPGILRIPALRDRNKNKEILYKISMLIAMI